MSLINTSATVVLVNTRNQPGTVLLPPTAQIPGRTVTIKDAAGNCQRSTCSIATSGADLFEDLTAIKVLDTNYGFYQLSASTNRWFIRNTTEPASFVVRNLFAETINASTIELSTATTVPQLQFPDAPLFVSSSGFLYWGQTLLCNGPVAQTPQVLFS